MSKKSNIYIFLKENYFVNGKLCAICICQKLDELPVHADWLAILDLGQRSQRGPLG